MNAEDLLKPYEGLTLDELSEEEGLLKTKIELIGDQGVPLDTAMLCYAEAVGVMLMERDALYQLMDCHSVRSPEGQRVSARIAMVEEIIRDLNEAYRERLGARPGLRIARPD